MQADATSQSSQKHCRVAKEEANTKRPSGEFNEADVQQKSQRMDSDDSLSEPACYAAAGTKKSNAPARAAKKPIKYKKNPDAPKRFRSAFIIFSKENYREIRAQLQSAGIKNSTMNIARAISEKWRKMGPRERESWEEKAHRDKERYMFEKDQFEGPWKVAANKRKLKDPTSPKKPVPAYFAFSNSRRQQVKNDNPSATNAEVSKLLSNMWKEAPKEMRNQYLEEETARRKVYTVAIGEWRQENELKLKNKAEEEARRLTEQASMNAARQVSQDGSSAGTHSHHIGGRDGNRGHMTIEDQEARASEASSSQNSSIRSRQGMPQIQLGLGGPTAAVQQFASGIASSLGNNGDGQGHGNGQQTLSSNELIAALAAMSGNPFATPLLSAATNNTSAPPASAFNSNTSTDLGELMSKAIVSLFSGGQLGGIAQPPAPPLLQSYSHVEDSQHQSLMLLQSLLGGQQQQQQQQQNLLVQQLGQQSEQQHQLGGIPPSQPGQLNLSAFLANQGTNTSQFWNDQGQQAHQQQQLLNSLFGQGQNTFQHHQPQREDERHR